mmetsp:Transcript_8463/g.26217  ORF Transcript_8463/g.26217 Transcript_8463/m.26217 type:complete len:237 (+) Transcript_8463:2154-2864(+)
MVLYRFEMSRGWFELLVTHLGDFLLGCLLLEEQLLTPMQGRFSGARLRGWGWRCRHSFIGVSRLVFTLRERERQRETERENTHPPTQPIHTITYTHHHTHVHTRAHTTQTDPTHTQVHATVHVSEFRRTRGDRNLRGHLRSPRHHREFPRPPSAPHLPVLHRRHFFFHPSFPLLPPLRFTHLQATTQRQRFPIQCLLPVHTFRASHVLPRTTLRPLSPQNPLLSMRKTYLFQVFQR